MYHPIYSLRHLFVVGLRPQHLSHEMEMNCWFWQRREYDADDNGGRRLFFLLYNFLESENKEYLWVAEIIYTFDKSHRVQSTNDLQQRFRIQLFDDRTESISSYVCNLNRL